MATFLPDTTETVAWYVPGIGDFIPQIGKVSSYQDTIGADFDLWRDWKGNLQTSYGRDDSYAQYRQLNPNVTARINAPATDISANAIALRTQVSF